MFAPLVTALLFAVKGGQHGRVREWLASRADNVNGWFGVIVDRALDGKILSTLGFGLLCLFLTGSFTLPALAWLVGCAPSLGEEIGAIGGFKGNWRTEGRAWGWKRGLQRGVFMGAMLALALGDTGFILMGAAFPLCVWAGVSMQQLATGKVSVSWHKFEWLYGAALGLPFLI